MRIMFHKISNFDQWDWGTKIWLSHATSSLAIFCNIIQCVQSTMCKLPWVFSYLPSSTCKIQFFWNLSKYLFSIKEIEVQGFGPHTTSSFSLVNLQLQFAICDWLKIYNLQCAIINSICNWSMDLITCKKLFIINLIPITQIEIQNTFIVVEAISSASTC